MPIPIACKSCGSKFNAPDSAGGKRTSCPKCGGVIEIPAAEQPEEILEAEVEPSQAFEDDEFEVEPPPEAPESRRPCPKCGEMILVNAVKCRFCDEVFDKSVIGAIGGSSDFNAPAWQKVRSGLSILYVCLVTIIVVVILIIVGAVVTGMAAAGGQGNDIPVVLIILMVIGGLIILGAGIGTIVGQVKCASVPENSGARGFALGAAICMLANILISFAGGAADMQALSGLGNLISLIGSVLFILFIRRSAAYLGDLDLSASAGRFLMFSIAMAVGGFVIAILAAVLQMPVLFAIFGLAAVVLALVFVVWYLRLIKSLILLIEHRAGTG